MFAPVNFIRIFFAMKTPLIILALTFTAALSASAQKFEELAPTPPMGWISWNKFGCDVSAKLIMEMADAMVKSGMKDAGYQYVEMGEREIWVKFLKDGELAACFLNRAETRWTENYEWSLQNIYHEDKTVRFGKQNFSMRDLWQAQNLGDTGKPLTLDIPPHGVTLVRLKPVK